MNRAPSSQDWWRVVEIYGLLVKVDGEDRVVARERAHGPYETEWKANHAITLLESSRARKPIEGECGYVFAIEKGTITWQEN